MLPQGKPKSSLTAVLPPPLLTPNRALAVFFFIDAVQKFKVELSSYSAQFGRSGSGIVYAILKSGTNQLARRKRY